MTTLCNSLGIEFSICAIHLVRDGLNQRLNSLDVNLATAVLETVPKHCRGQEIKNT